MARDMIRSYFEVEVALVVSLLLHAAMFGISQNRAALARVPFLRPLAKLVEIINPPPRAVVKRTAPAIPTLTFVEVVETKKAEASTQQKKEQDTARTFIETTPNQASTTQPKDAKFYSDKSSAAANPDNPTGKVGDTPYLKGRETRVMSTDDVSMPQPPSRPATPPPPPVVTPPAPKVEPVPVVKPAPPKVVEPPKEIAAKGTKVAEPPKPVQEPGGAMVVRPTIAQVQPSTAFQPAPDVPAGPSRPGSSSGREIGALKSKLDASGVAKIGVAAFNVASSPFGEYDKKIVRAVQSRWYALIDRYGIYERVGTVELHFQLYDDGTVHHLEAVENSAGEILRLFCEKAVLESAPFDPLPDELRRLVGKEPRDVNFTFYY